MAYTIKFTDKTKSPIVVNAEEIDNSTDITLFGRKRLFYGQSLQENLLHILERFACPEDPDVPGTPDVLQAVSLQNPIEGQLWYNNTRKIPNQWNGTEWVPFALGSSLAANWGLIADGETLPKPVDEITGKVFNYDECVWVVSPFNTPYKIDYLLCETNFDAIVTSKYRLVGSSSLSRGMANYLIVGIAGNVNMGGSPVDPTPTPTPSPTGTIGISVTPTPTREPSPTPPASPYPSSAPGVSRTPQPTPVPTATPTKTPPVSPTRSPTRTPAMSPTPAPTHTPPASPSPSPNPPLGGCETCIQQCSNHGGVNSIGVGCECNDGTYLDCL